MKLCEVCGSKTNIYLNKHTGKYLCYRHSMQIRRHGKILKRTIYDPNEIVIKDGYAEVVLYNKECIEVGRAIIDEDDIGKITKHKWRLGNGYAFTTIKGKNVGMHRCIMDASHGEMIDHIDRNRLDNRKQNLRLCSYRENTRNRSMLDENKSGVTGVYYSKRDDKWITQIKINHKAIHLGSHKDLDYAKVIRLKAEQIVFKDFSPNKDLFYELDKYDELNNIKTIDELREYLNIGYNNSSKLNKDQVVDIKKLLLEGELTQKQIAKLYNVHVDTISRINTGVYWSDVEISI